METWDISQMEVDPHLPAVLRSDHGAARCILIQLPAGERLQDHEVHEHAWLHVQEGEIEIVEDGQPTRGGTGFLAHFPPHERHEVRAAADARLLLLLAPWPGEGRREDFDA